MDFLKIKISLINSIFMNKDKYHHSIDVVAFIEEIELSKKRRAKYYDKKSKIPNKYKKKDYDFDKNGILVHIESGQKIIKNTRTIGTPNVKKINGQYFWSGAHPHIRRKIKREMSIFFYEHMKDIPTIQEHQYPIGIRIDLYDNVNQGSDLDNFIYLYRKVIHDVLVADDMEHDPIIIDDSKKYIQDIPTKFYPIEDHDKRRLHIEIYSL